MESNSNPNSSTLEPDLPQHDSPAVCYHPTAFFSYSYLTALSLTQKKSERLKTVTSISNCLLKTAPGIA
jgi:hypothetical protein